MAKTTDTTISWFGSQSNERQMKIGIPAGPASNKGGLLYLERENAGTVDAGGWLHTDGTDLLWTSGATAPSDTNTGTALGGIANLDEAFDAATKGVIDGSIATGNGNAFSVGGPATDDKVEIYHNSTEAHIHARADDLFLSAVGGDIDFSSDNIKSVTNLTISGTFTDGTASLVGGVLTSATYDGLTIATGTNTFTLTRGTGSLDVAAGKAVDINGAVTIHSGGFTTTAACTIDQNLRTTDDPTFDALTVTSVTDGTATLTGGAASGISTLAMTSYLRIADDQQIQLGAAFSADSYIQYDSTGNDLEFYDRTAGGPYTLSQLVAGTPLNPIVTGDLTISDGQFDWVNTAAGDSNTWDFANTTGDIFDITADHITTGALFDINADLFTTGQGIIDINADAITSGTMIHLDTDQTGQTFHFIECLEGSSADAFTVSQAGATVIAGVNNVTAALTLTAGKLVLTDGWIDSDISNVAATGHNFATAANATATIPLMTLTASDAAFDQPLLFLDSRATTDINCLEIDNYGTGFGISIDLANKTDAEGLEIIFDTASTHNGILLDGGTGTYVGADTYGMLKIHQTGTLAHANASAIFIDFDGTCAANGKGYALLIDDNGGAIASSYAMAIDSNANVPLYLKAIGATKEALVVETNANTAAGVLIEGATNDWQGADNVGMLHISSDLAYGDTGASSLVCRQVTGAPINNAEGFLARFLDEGGAGGGTNEYAVEIYSNNNDALHVSKGATLLAGTLEVTSTQTFTAAGTFTHGAQSLGYARTASTNGVGTGLIAAGAKFVDVTSTNATHIIHLPTPVLGNILFLKANGATDFELGVQATTQYLNNVLCSANEEMVCDDEHVIVAICTKGGTAGTWVTFSVTKDGTVTDGGAVD